MFHNENSLFREITEYHGTSGPLVISDSSHTPLKDIYIQAGLDMGYEETDCNGQEQIGMFTLSCSTDNLIDS